MKTTFLSLMLLLLTAVGYCQSTGFVALDNKLVWENVFVYPVANVPAIVAKHGKLKIISTDGKLYKGRATGVMYRCSGCSAVFKYGYNFDFEIEVANDKYRVTISNVTFNNSRNGETKTPAEKPFLQTGKIKQTADVVTDITCLDTFFNKIFSGNALKGGNKI